MRQGLNLLNRLSNVFTKDTNSLLGQMMGAVGSQFDTLDTAQNNLADEFSVSTAIGDALDKHGVDCKVPRRYGEPDETYRARIMAMLPIYINGPTRAAIKTIVRNFSGADPEIIEWGPMSFTMGVTPMGQFVFNSNDPFEFQVRVSGSQAYKMADLETAIEKAKPARATATFVHGTGGI